MSTIIINNADSKQTSVISELAKLLHLDVSVEKKAPSSKAEIKAAMDAYEKGHTQGLKISAKDFKRMIDGLKQDN